MVTTFFVLQRTLNNMFNFTLEIDGKPVSIDKVKNGRDWSSIYINGYASCHSIPSHLIANNSTYKTITFKTGGHVYKVTK